jgi:hypothetical protein
VRTLNVTKRCVLYGSECYQHGGYANVRTLNVTKRCDSVVCSMVPSVTNIRICSAESVVVILVNRFLYICVVVILSCILRRVFLFTGLQT